MKKINKHDSKKLADKDLDLVKRKYFRFLSMKLIRQIPK